MGETSPAVKQATSIKVDQMTAASQLIYASADQMRQAAGEVSGVFASHERWLMQFLDMAKTAIDERLDRLERIMVKGGHEQHTVVVCLACGKSLPRPNCVNAGGYSGCGVPAVIILEPPKG